MTYLKLHRWYSVEQILFSFPGIDRAEFFCDGQFVALPDTVVCFIALGAGETASHVETSSCLTWMPRRLDYAPKERLPWLPEKLRRIFADDDRRAPLQHVFLRGEDDDPSRYFYAGEVDLTGVAIGGRRAVNFELKERLPRSAWLRFGGYPGWMVEVNHKWHRVEPGDASTFASLAGELVAGEHTHLWMMRYEQDSLSVLTNDHCAWLMYARAPGDRGLRFRDPAYEGDRQAEELFLCTCGIDSKFPASSTLPRADAARVAVTFFETGKLPEWINWVEADAI